MKKKKGKGSKKKSTQKAKDGEQEKIAQTNASGATTRDVISTDATASSPSTCTIRRSRSLEALPHTSIMTFLKQQRTGRTAQSDTSEQSGMSPSRKRPPGSPPASQQSSKRDKLL